MKLYFKSETVEIETTEFDILTVGFYTEENYLIIQQSFDESDKQDVESGMKTYHIERDDQSLGGYGGVEQINLSRNSIEVELNETGKENLECDSVKVDFDTDNENYQLLTEKLRQIFGDSLIVK